MDFDEFMTIAQETGAEPVLVVCYDSMYGPTPSGGTIPTRAQLLETAVEWVRYANITKQYRVKYWEIGNETYLLSNNGGTTADQYAADLREFSDGMKAVDPAIKIGANGLGMEWWETVLTHASSKIDFLSVHVYPVWAWQSYDYYRRETLDFTPSLLDAINAINTYAAPQDRPRLRVAVTETNVLDWAPTQTWSNVNDLGHALVVFDLVGQLLTLPKIEFVQFWTTRWVDHHSPLAIFDALDDQNNLSPAGKALSIWGRWAGQRLVAATGEEPIHPYASYTPEEDRLTLFLLNRQTATHTASIVSAHPISSPMFERWVFRGAHPEDVHPVWEQLRDVPVTTPIFVNLDPLSITVLTEKRTTLRNLSSAETPNK